nr:MAG TPA: hypothetical protein [Microviridae sp.]
MNSMRPLHIAQGSRPPASAEQRSGERANVVP